MYILHLNDSEWYPTIICVLTIRQINLCSSLTVNWNSCGIYVVRVRKSWILQWLEDELVFVFSFVGWFLVIFRLVIFLWKCANFVEICVHLVVVNCVSYIFVWLGGHFWGTDFWWLFLAGWRFLFQHFNFCPGWLGGWICEAYSFFQSNSVRTF